jgi:hypothetical protein
MQQAQHLGPVAHWRLAGGAHAVRVHGCRGVWGPHLVVVPTSVMLNWEVEFKRWCPAFKLLTYYGSAKERRAKRQGWSKPNAFHVAITSYTLVLQAPPSPCQFWQLTTPLHPRAAGAALPLPILATHHPPTPSSSRRCFLPSFPPSPAFCTLILPQPAAALCVRSVSPGRAAGMVSFVPSMLASKAIPCRVNSPMASQGGGLKQSTRFDECSAAAVVSVAAPTCE